MRQSHTLLACIALCSGSAMALPPHVRVVKQDAAPGGNGQTWQQAYAGLQQALDEAQTNPMVTEIWVAAGMYAPTRESVAGDPRSRTFLLGEGVSIYGGFSGTEDARNKRSIAFNSTMLSGAGLSPRPNHVVTAIGPGAGTLDGFTITAGQAAGAGEHSRGGGVLILGADPVLADCRIVGNEALAGGGLYIAGGSPTLIRCTIEGNAVSSAGIGGGGILLEGGDLTVIESTIAENLAVGPTAGGGVAVNGGSVELLRCRIVANYAESGAALYCTGGQARAVNSLFMDNFGGLVGENLTLINCTVFRNPAEPVAWSGVNGTGMLLNSIVWGNAEEDWEGIAPQVWGGISVAYSCVEPNSVGPQISGPGLTREHPRLTVQGQPGEQSSAIDAGMNAALGGDLGPDLAGYTRFVDDAGMPDRGAGEGAIVDLGALEFQGTTCYANCDGSTGAPILSIPDFACFMGRFGAGDPLANCDGSVTPPVLNVGDFSCFVSKFIAGCP